MELKFFMPTKVLIGKDVVLNNSNLLKEFGTKALIVTGRSSSKKNGSLDNVISALKKENIGYIIFDEIEENPSVESVVKAADLGKSENVDFIIGIGGGSPIDASKAIGVMIKNKDLTGETLFSIETLESIDIVAVPTTAGTGTETTQYSIITDHKNKTKRNLGQSIFAKLALVDASYMMGMNANITRNTAFDAVSHIVEGYLNTNANLITDGLCEKALSVWGECIPSLLKGEFTLSDREKLMLASNMAGIIIAQTGTSIPHGMGYPLTYFKNVSHGLANGCLYKEYLKVFKNREKVNNIYKCLGLKSYEELEDIIDKLTKINIDVSEEELRVWSRDFAANKGKLKNHPESITEKEIFEIYKNSLIK
ncbi:MAG: iron-containing alcohol dehydrogenase family protein [Clostridium perfringens]|nr:iron-containing alcohol dehydrogenase family protein [Clostridium perfringens]